MAQSNSSAADRQSAPSSRSGGRRRRDLDQAELVAAVTIAQANARIFLALAETATPEQLNHLGRALSVAGNRLLHALFWAAPTRPR